MTHAYTLYLYVHVTSRLLADYTSLIRPNAEAVHDINIHNPATTIIVAFPNTFVMANQLTTFQVSICGYGFVFFCFSWSRIGSEKEQDHQHQVRRRFSDDSSLDTNNTNNTRRIMTQADCMRVTRTTAQGVFLDLIVGGVELS